MADTLYWWLVFRSFRWSALKKSQKLKNSGLMITKNNFKIAGRVLWRDKYNTAINLVGLTIGITCFLLLGLYVRQELSYDQFHSKKDRIYRLILREDYGLVIPQVPNVANVEEEVELYIDFTANAVQ